ncbi:uncharacterized protein N7498_000542 [Penicillium cinerascens]|uniref:MYND-type domain-containing protein n=1 Tax=Penicillium cinerascens TaxID=70096 RepID=A0A9W9NER1_9EURO|nr:uncharacterized protein N7498_000542 [Penicillium cinerascens]KAJ5218443.1 hypothetical protein N7498_000542 [Penicillium cinerascens]
MADATSTADKCYNCNKSEAEGGSLMRNSRCKSAWYRSRDCQKAGWKNHKKICASFAQSAAEAQAARETRSASGA